MTTLEQLQAYLRENPGERSLILLGIDYSIEHATSLGDWAHVSYLLELSGCLLLEGN